MYRFLTRYRSSQSNLFLTASIAGFLACSSAAAQTTVFTDQYGNPTVSVDYTVLDRLGPPPSLPDLYRQTAPAPSRPVMGSRLPAPARGSGYLAKPPRQMPRSTLNLPNTATSAAPPNPLQSRGVTSRPTVPPALAPTRAVTPPAPASITREKRLTKVEKPIRRAETPSVRPAAVPKSKLTLPQKVASRVPAAPKAPAVKRPSPPSAPKVAAIRKAPAPVAPPPALPKPAIAPPKALAAPKPVKAPPAPTAPAAVAPPPIKRPAISAPPVAAPPVAAPKPTTRIARAAAPSAPTGNVAVSPDGNLFSIPFAVTKTDLPPNALPSLDKLADRMKTDEDIRIQLMGFANGNSGSASQARRSSLFRALSVRNYLMKQGVRTTRMDVRALGQTSVKGVPPDRVDIVVQP
ncbi:MAG: hypothetical protein CMM59_21940 [Rhodospirillaceae bacterium]|nr:hypothetical protein [Rhodospirillaceae bacterium]